MLSKLNFPISPKPPDSIRPNTTQFTDILFKRSAWNDHRQHISRSNIIRLHRIGGRRERKNMYCEKCLNQVFGWLLAARLNLPPHLKLFLCHSQAYHTAQMMWSSVRGRERDLLIIKYEKTFCRSLSSDSFACLVQTNYLCVFRESG